MFYAKERKKAMNGNDYNHSISLARYILQMRPVFNSAAVFSDETGQYVTPMEPSPGETVHFRIRTARSNVDAVFLISGPMRIAMKLEERAGSFDYYAVDVKVGVARFRYYYELISGKAHYYYNKLGITRDLGDRYAFAVCPGFCTPDWAKGAVMYQILTDRFFNGDPSNDVLDNEYVYIGEGVTRVTDWGKRPEKMGVREFYGGDLEGVLQKLDYLADLGIEVIYFNPLFVSPSNHKYDTQDYDYIDPHFGKFELDEGELLGGGCRENAKASRYICRVTRLENLEAANRTFIRLVEACHSRGIRVILDGVFNHCGSFNKWMDRERIYEHQEGYEKGAYVSAASPYRSFFHFTNEHEWPYNPYYDGWWGHDTLPKLNYEDSDKLERYILDIAAKWVSPPFNADGWRLDVAADLGSSPEYNHQFWKKFRRRVKAANPDAIILAEHYGDAYAWLQGDQWDTVMNYDAFMEPLGWFLTGMEKHSDEYRESQLGNAADFEAAMRYNMASFMAPSLLTAMNELSNHDHSRFLTRTNRKVGRMDHFDYDAASEGVLPEVMRMAVAVQMTWPGAPTLYYGDEAGVCGFTDPDNRRTYPWGHEDQDLLAFHREAIAVHKKHTALRTGSYVFLHGDRDVICYGRFDRREQILVLVNNAETEEKYLNFPVFPAGIEEGSTLVCLLRTDGKEASGSGTYAVSNGKIMVHIPPRTALVLGTAGDDSRGEKQ